MTSEAVFGYSANGTNTKQSLQLQLFYLEALEHTENVLEKSNLHLNLLKMAEFNITHISAPMPPLLLYDLYVYNVV